MANPAANNLANPFIRQSHVVDLFIDFEFVDRGNKGTHLVSFGAMVCGSQKAKSFYGISTDFFKSPVFRDTVIGNDDNSKWLLEHVFVHITGTAVAGSEHKKGRITELLDLLKEEGSVFTPDFDQTYPTPVDDWSVETTEENDPDVIVVGTPEKIKQALHETIDDVREVRKKDDIDNIVRTWGYYTSTDFVLLQNLHGGMLSMPENFYYYSYDLRAIGDVFGYDHDAINPPGPHHALSDALAQYQTTQKLRNMVSEDLGTRFVPNPNSFW